MRSHWPKGYRWNLYEQTSKIIQKNPWPPWRPWPYTSTSRKSYRLTPHKIPDLWKRRSPCSCRSHRKTRKILPCKSWLHTWTHLNDLSLSAHTFVCRLSFYIMWIKIKKHNTVFFATQYCVFLILSAKYVVKCMI